MKMITGNRLDWTTNREMHVESDRKIVTEVAAAAVTLAVPEL